MAARARHGGQAAEILTFLIADVRGYTRFTQARGDEAAALLASAFAEIAREGVEARGGRVLELRGDEALAVFPSARQALRAGVELQHVFVDEVELDPSLPLTVGMGLDAGEAVPVEGGYRGGALNLAARLCSQAGPGDVLTSQGVLHLARAVEGLRYIEHGQLELKGLSEPVAVHLVVEEDDEPGALAERLEAALSDPGRRRLPGVGDVPAPLVTLTPLCGRDEEARSLRWAWRRARAGWPQLAVLTGPEGIGKTRLAAEVAGLAAVDGATLLYASSLGASTGLAAAVDSARSAEGPALLVLDDVEAADPAEVSAAGELIAARERRLLVVCAYRDDEAPEELKAALGGLSDGDAVRHRLGPLDEGGVKGIASLYADLAGSPVPLDVIVAESNGVPALVHRAASAWVHEQASKRLGEAASRTAAGRSGLHELESELATNVLELQRVEERTRSYSEKTGRDGGDVCPFKGLASFEPADAALFFGRERLVAELVSRLAGAKLVGVVGPSGSGKSSVVRAGLLPALAAGVLPGSERWVRVLVRPGEHPMRELDRAVYAAFPDELRGRLSSGDDPLAGGMKAVEPGSRLAVVIDQFEEAFAVADAVEREAFVQTVVHAARDTEARAVVVLALRADFFGRCAEHPALAELLGANTVLVGAMTADEYARAIEQPARRAGLRIDPPLVDALVAEVVDEPGGLPLLSTALVELWQRRDGRALRLEAYEQTGGVRGAVARLAEEAYGNITASQQGVARAVLLRLTAGEGESVVRRRVPLAEFDAAGSEDVRGVLDAFTRDRLLTVSEGAVEVAHEALLREWPRLAEWLDEDREGRRLREHLTDQAKEWDERGRDSAELYRGPRLTAALDWTTGHTLELNQLEREFLDESRVSSEREAERQRRANRRLRGLLVGVGVLLALAVVAGVLALAARGDAKDAEIAAVAQRLGAQALVAKDIDLSLLLARQGVEIDDSSETLANLESALVRSPAAIRVSRPLPGRLLAVDASDDGRWVGYGNNDGKLAFVDTSTGRVARIVDGNGWGFLTRDQVVVGRDSPDRIRLFEIDLGSGAESPWGMVSKPSDDQPWFFSITDDSRISALLPPTGEVTLRYVRTGRVLRRFRPVPGSTPFADVNFRGEYLVVTSMKELFVPDAPARFEIWHVEPWRLVATVDDPRGNFPFTLDKAGRWFAVGHPDGSVTIWDVASGQSHDLNGRHNAAVVGVGFSPDGNTIVTTGDDAQVLVWDAESGELRETLTGHNGRAFGPGFSPDGKTVYTVGLDGAAITWDLEGSRRLARPLQTAGNPRMQTVGEPTSYVAVSPDGKRIAVPQAGRGVAVIELETGKRLYETSPPAGKVLDVGWSPDGKEIAIGSVGGELEIWSASDGSRVQKQFRGTPAKLPPSTDLPPGATNDVHAVAYSPDGKQLAAALSDGRVLRWDATTGESVGEPLDPGTNPRGPALDLAFSPEGDKLAAAIAFLGDEGGVAIVWSLPRGEELYRANIDDGYGRGSAVAFTPDGTILATGGGSGEIKFWDAATGHRVGSSLTGTAGWVSSLEFDPTGRTLVSGSTDGFTRLWDVARRAPFGTPLPGLENLDLTARLVPDGTRAVVVHEVGQGFVWQLEPDVWKQQACSVAGRTLTEREWELYLPDREYDPACAE